MLLFVAVVAALGPRNPVRDASKRLVVALGPRNPVRGASKGLVVALGPRNPVRGASKGLVVAMGPILGGTAFVEVLKNGFCGRVQ